LCHAKHFASRFRDFRGDGRGPCSASTVHWSFSRQRLAQKPDPKLMDKGVVKFKVGELEVIQMYDGLWEKAHDPNFVKNASLDEVKAALKAGGLTEEFVPIPVTVTAVKAKGKLVLFDAGTGGQVSPKAGLVAS
jgi:hypothetical protein